MVQAELNGTVLGRLSEAGARAQVPGRARDADGPQRCERGKQRVGQTETSGGVFMRRPTSSKAGANRTGSLRKVRLGPRLMGFQSVIRDVGESPSTIVYSGATAALGVIQRQGAGRLRRVDCSFLFVQSLNARKVVQYANLPATGLNAEVTRVEASGVSGWPMQCRRTNVMPRSSWNPGFSRTVLHNATVQVEPHS